MKKLEDRAGGLRRAAPVDCAIFWGLLLLPSLLMSGALLRGAIPYFMDTMMYFYPLRVQAARVLAGGELPLWNRGMMGGMPLFENPQAALGYVFNWPSLLWPTGFWFTFPMTLQLGLYGALTAWALRRMGVGRWHAAWVGAMALAGGYGWSRLQSGNYMNVLPWLPLWLGAAHGFAATRRARFLAAGALAVGMMLLAGAHQLAAYALAAFGLYTLAQAALARGERVFWLLFGTASVVLGLLLGALGWLPQLGFIRETTRSDALDAAQVTAGSYRDIEPYFNALQGNLAQLKLFPGEPWVDAEDCATVGVLILALALLVPTRGPLRRAWIGCWLGIGFSLALAAQPVVAWLLQVLPASGMFHDPRRWLGVTQWLLLIAAGVNLPTLARAPAAVARGSERPPRWYVDPHFWRMVSVGSVVLVLAGWVLIDRSLSGVARGHLLLGLLAVSGVMLLRDGFLLRARRRLEPAALLLGLALLAHATWVSVDRAMLPATALTRAEAPPMLAQAGLRPGERFFSLDYERAVSYDFRADDVLHWMRPNLALLFGYEDLGGYEPAQSSRFRAFMDAIHAAEPWRRIAPNHFGVVQNAAAAEAFDVGNVHYALLPRWGEPLFMQPMSGDIWRMQTPLTMAAPVQLRALAIAEQGATTVPLSLTEHSALGLQYRDLEPARALTTAADWARPNTEELDTQALPFNPALRLSQSVLPAPGGRGGEWRIRAPQGARLAGAFAWDARRSALWEPVAQPIDSLALLARYRGAPRRYVGRDAQGGAVKVTIVSEQIQSNHVRVEYDAAGAAGSQILLTQHDAWWPGWQAELDGTWTELRPEGMWRQLTVPAGRHVIEFRYEQASLDLGLMLTIGGLGILAFAAVRIHQARSLGPDRACPPRPVL